MFGWKVQPWQPWCLLTWDHLRSIARHLRAWRAVPWFFCSTEHTALARAGKGSNRGCVTRTLDIWFRKTEEAAEPVVELGRRGLLC